MQKQLDTPPTATDLSDLGAIRAQGPDAVKFLQGQLSNDVAKLQDAGSLLAGLHNPQGRTIALLRLIWLAPQDILAILPRELAPVVVLRLSQFVLRAKVKIADESADWRVTGVTSLPPAPRETYHSVSLAPRSSRAWLVGPVHDPAALEGYATLDRESWRALDIAAGLPQVYARTSEAFVAQMLNLDVLGAIAFDKGCYTGQEIIARAHYRGRVKRRMQRFRCHATQLLAPGDTRQLADGRAIEIVDIAAVDDHWCEFLAVAPQPAALLGDMLAGASVEASNTAIHAEQLPLPYE